MAIVKETMNQLGHTRSAHRRNHLVQTPAAFAMFSREP
jgi:hypothetical protein